jgi:hypothetical protein
VMYRATYSIRCRALELHGSRYRYQRLEEFGEKWILVTYSSLKRLIGKSTNKIFC